MEVLPVRCSRCGCISSGGLIISASLREPTTNTEVIVGPDKCPLCMRTISDESAKLADSLRAVLHEAMLNPSESDALMNVLMHAYNGKLSHQETVKAIDASAPKAAGLKKFIPPGDVTGALALIIAILTFVNEFVSDWVAPALGQSTGEKHNQPAALPQQSRQVDLSSLDVPVEMLQNGRHRFNLKGSWSGGEKDRLFRMQFWGCESPHFFEVSKFPGSWECSLGARFPPWPEFNVELINALYIAVSGEHFSEKLNKKVALAAAVLPFEVRVPSSGKDMTRIKLITVGKFINLYNELIERAKIFEM